jgi:hypothetical protein
MAITQPSMESGPTGRIAHEEWTEIAMEYTDPTF